MTDVKTLDADIAMLREIIRRVATHEWIIATAYDDYGPNPTRDFGYAVNTRDDPSRSTKSQTYTYVPQTFGLTPIEAGIRGLKFLAGRSPTGETPE